MSPRMTNSMESPKPIARLLLAAAVFLATATSAAASDPTIDPLLAADLPAAPLTPDSAMGPSAPTDLAAYPTSFDEAANEATVLLTWQPPAEDADVAGYLVYRSVLVGPGSADVPLLAGGTTETIFEDTVTGLDAYGMAVVHEYHVTATDGLLESAPSVSTYSTGSSSSGAGGYGSGPSCAGLVIDVPPHYGVNTKCVTRLVEPLPLMDCNFVPFRTAMGDPC